MKKIVLASALCASMLLAANSEYKYEITPMIGGVYTEGNLDLERNYPAAGLSLGFNLDDSMFDQIELGFLQSIGDVDYKNSNDDTGITRIFSNVIKEYPLNEKSSLYALVGAGVEVFSNELFNNETGLFGNYGFGYKYKFDNDMALKFDLRHLIETDHGDNNLLYTVGLAIPFGQKAQPTKVSEPVEEAKAVATELDSDNDGVADKMDACPNSAPNAIVDETGCAITVNLKVLFDFDKATIKEAYTGKLSRFAEVLKAYPMINTQLSAHTDSFGDDDYNMKLSKQRAAAVKQALINLGIKDTRITTEGFGETKPVATNETADGRAQNRRVEATVSK